MMQTVLPSEFKRGMVLMVGGAPEVLEEFHFSGTAQTKPKLHARLRHLKTGRLTEHTFAESERVPIADAQYRRVQFSYHHGENYAFSDVETFEELTLSAEQIGERRLFIKENEEYPVHRQPLSGHYSADDCDPGSSGCRWTHPRRF
jgi:elongation factor P